jgi:hypothetical protein
MSRITAVRACDPGNRIERLRFGAAKEIGANVMRRTVLFLVLGVIVTGVFLSGLVWMTSLRERGWSNDPTILGRQATFVYTLIAVVIGASVLNHVLNRRRYFGATSTESNPYSPRPQIPDDTLHDHLLDR